MEPDFYSKFERNISELKKSDKRILDVDNVLYQHTKCQPEIPYILGLTKMTKSDRIWRIEILYCSLL
jgi:hypothetical protein